MDLLKKVKDSFSKTKIVYVKDPGDLGVVHTINIYGFGEQDDPDNYDSVGTDKGEELFRTLLKRLYHIVLHKDPEWHYFMEGTFNHLRFSYGFWEEIQEILDLHEAHYDEWPEVWEDEQGITAKYQSVFQKLFHDFSLMAMQGYEEDEIDLILDRVIHCFMNHQQLYLLKHREAHGAMTEALLVARYAAKRGEYTGYCAGVNAVKEKYNEYAGEVRDHYLEDCKKKQDALEEYKTSADEILKMVAELEPEEAKIALEAIKEAEAKHMPEMEEI